MAGAGWALRPACLAQVGGALGSTVLATLEVAEAAAPPSGQRSGDGVVGIRFLWVRPNTIPGGVGFVEPGLSSGEDNLRGRARIVCVAADPGWATVRLDEDGPPGVICLHMDVGWRPKPRSGVTVVVDEDGPPIGLGGTVVSDAVSHDSGAPRQIGSVMKCSRVEPHLYTWGVDLGTHVADVVRQDVEGCGRGFGLNVSPRVGDSVARVSILVAAT